ncbi:mycothiol transferase [Nocardiopsis lambiniae]|uniref:DUF664 domain-containing protein n=1 Tax=Nocardiopsis lambiniae TaxID=3075539 RepID=A0ABU2M4Z3_9ACTN|nr:DUF664 domain-containing protein [Nocardiopsis sp. DSM 44743]MDT0327719.1 DUF664 domain-containing protein [Nocardiopsis sp. DSM 44743]
MHTRRGDHRPTRRQQPEGDLHRGREHGRGRVGHPHPSGTACPPATPTRTDTGGRSPAPARRTGRADRRRRRAGRARGADGRGAGSRATDDPDQDFEDLSGDPVEALARWRAEVERSREITAASSLDDLGADAVHGGPAQPRVVLVKPIGEYARHDGHAGLLRERIDGATGC